MTEDRPTEPNPVPSPVEGQRTFTLNSREFYDAVTPPPDPWRWGPGLPSEPRARDRRVIVESRDCLAAIPLSPRGRE